MLESFILFYKFRSTNRSDPSMVENRPEIKPNMKDPNSSLSNLQHIEDDLAKLNQSFEDIKKQLKILVEVNDLVLSLEKF